MLRRRRREETGSGASSTGHLIDLRDVIKTYRTPAGDFTALKNIDLTVDAGEFVAIIGKSGSGKSTLINMITGIDRPTAGKVHVGGLSIGELGEGQLAAWRGRTIGVVFQFFQLLPTLTNVENVMLPMDFGGLYPGRQRHDRALDLLDQVGLAEHAYKLPTAISGGQQQRVAIARALANDPPILVADEPTGNLDSQTAESIIELFEAFVARGKTVVMVTHDRDLAQRAMRNVILADGEIVNEYLARALPALSEETLLTIMRRYRPERHAPGVVLLQEGAAARQFFIITDGHVEVVVRGSQGQEVIATTMAAGQFFGEIELLRGGANLATIRSGADTGVEVIALDRPLFEQLLAESAQIKETLERTVQERMAENIASREPLTAPAAFES